MSHCVIVTFGNALRDQKYVSGVTEEEADTLRVVAVRAGYRDAVVWVEKKWDAIQRARLKARAEARRSCA